MVTLPTLEERVPVSNFARDLEVARSGSPSNISARSKYYAQGTVGAGVYVNTVLHALAHEYLGAVIWHMQTVLVST